ncbi:zinc finger protein, partial [Clarias magur]
VRVVQSPAVLLPTHTDFTSAETSRVLTMMNSDEIKCENFGPIEISSAHQISP